MSRSVYENIKQYAKQSKYIYSSQDEKMKFLNAIMKQSIQKNRYKKDERLKRQEKALITIKVKI